MSDMFGMLFDADEGSMLSHGPSEEEKAAAMETLPDELSNVSLRRNISLSKNTISALTARLSAIDLDMVDIKTTSTTKIESLQAQIDRERIITQDKLARCERERTAITVALEKAQKAEEKRQQAFLRGEISEEEIDATKCGVCMEGDRDSLIAPCGHIALCHTCAVAM